MFSVYFAVIWLLQAEPHSFMSSTLRPVASKYSLFVYLFIYCLSESQDNLPVKAFMVVNGLIKMCIKCDICPV